MKPRDWSMAARILAASLLLFLFLLFILGAAGVTGAWVGRLLAPVALVALLAFLKQRKFHWSTIVVLVGAALMYGSYVGYTSHGERNFDIEHQVKYIEYIVKHFWPPPDDHCFICHHPPLYYSCSAGIYSITKALGIVAPLRGVQMLSLLCVVLFAVAGAEILRRLSDNPWIVSLGTLLCALWPYTIILSARVHNDVLATTLMAWTVFACLRWYQDPKRKYLVWAVTLAVLSVLTKTNGYVVVGLIWVTVLYRAWSFWWSGHKVSMPRGESLHHQRTMLRFTLPLLLAMTVGLGAYAKLRGANKEKQEDAKTQNQDTEMTERLFGSAAKIGQRAWMHNEPYNYLYFDLREFLEEPYILAHLDTKGRQLYLNHLLKSSLFSTHNEHPDAETSYRLNRRLASIMNWMLLWLCIYVLVTAARSSKEDFRRNFVLVAAFFGFLAGGMLFRILVPHTHHSDFRHIFPILIPFCATYALGVEYDWKRKSLLGSAALLLGGSFIALTLFYFAPKYQWIRANSPVNWTTKNSGEIAKWVKAGTNWNQKGNVILEGTDGLRVKFATKPDATQLAISLDNNDKYQITLVGEKEKRTMELGPHPDKKAGMGEYLVDIEPPVRKVKKVLVKPLLGDHAFSVGHLILNPPKTGGQNPPVQGKVTPKPLQKPAQAVEPGPGKGLGKAPDNAAKRKGAGGKDPSAKAGPKEGVNAPPKNAKKAEKSPAKGSLKTPRKSPRRKSAPEKAKAGDQDLR